MIAGCIISAVIGFVIGWWTRDQYRPGPDVPIAPAAPSDMRYRPATPRPDVTPPWIPPQS